MGYPLSGGTNQQLRTPLGWRGVIGLIVPSLNSVMEHEFHSSVPDGIAVCTARYIADKSQGTDTFGAGQVPLSIEKMKEGVALAARQLSTVPRLGVVVFGCTSGSFIGEGGNVWGDELTTLIAEITGVEAVSASGAILQGLLELKVKSVSLVTPYNDVLNLEATSFLERNGFTVRKVCGLDLEDAESTSSLALQKRFAGIASVALDKESEAIVVSCTGFPTFDLIEYAEQDFRRPLVTSNQCCLWLALKKLRVGSQGLALGTLMRRIN